MTPGNQSRTNVLTSVQDFLEEQGRFANHGGAPEFATMLVDDRFLVIGEPDTEDCEVCHGLGSIEDDECSHCEGYGHLPREMALISMDLFKALQTITDTRHAVEFKDHEWVIAHPLSERIDGTLFDCPVTGDEIEAPGLGRYWIEDDGTLTPMEEV